MNLYDVPIDCFKICERLGIFTELNLYDVPIDCFKICEMLGIVVIKYSDVKEEKRKACKEFSKDGFCMEIEENGQSVIKT